MTSSLITLGLDAIFGALSISLALAVMLAIELQWKRFRTRETRTYVNAA